MSYWALLFSLCLHLLFGQKIKKKMKKAEKITIKVLKVVERIARNEVEKTVLGRTAECSAIYHQPKRPKKRGN